MKISEDNKSKREKVKGYLCYAWHNVPLTRKTGYKDFMNTIREQRAIIKRDCPRINNDSVFVIPVTDGMNDQIRLEYWVHRLETDEEFADRIKDLDEQAAIQKKKEEEIDLLRKLAKKHGYEVAGPDEEFDNKW